MKNKRFTKLTGFIALAVIIACLPFMMGAYEDQTRILGNGDYGDITSTNGVITLDADVVGADELANGDYGDVLISSGVITVDPNATPTVSTLTITNDLGVTSGGTGVSTLTDHGVMLGSDTNAVTVTDSGADGEVLVSNGSAADPDWEYLPRQNLLKNTGWVFCSNSDTAKGQGSLTYDGGTDTAGDTPDVGDAVTGDTSSATGKIIAITVATGTFPGDNATGVITLGACSGRFQDNETISFTDGEDATVNMPNSAAGVDKLQNGDFSVNTDPSPGWAVTNNATLTTEAGGKVGNCLMIKCDGTNSPGATQDITVIPGKNYYLNGYVKADTEATYWITIYDASNSATIYETGNKEAAADWTNNFTRYFVAPSGCTTVALYLYQTATAGAKTTLLFDEVSLYEVSPGCTGADALAFDGIWKDTTLDLYRYHDGTTDGSFYACMSVPSAQNDFFAWPQEYSQSYFYVRQQGRIITIAGYVTSSTASDIKAFIYDGAYTYSSAHSGGGAQEWLEVTDTISSTATNVHYGFIHTSATPGNAYIRQPIAVYGSSIGAGNYVPEADSRIVFEKDIASQVFNNKTGTSGFSDATNSTITLESDSLACIGKGVNLVDFIMGCNDVGSAATNVYMTIGSVASTTKYHGFRISPYDMTNDRAIYGDGYVGIGSTGIYYYTIDASGSSTWDIPAFRYTAAEWR